MDGMDVLAVLRDRRAAASSACARRSGRYSWRRSPIASEATRWPTQAQYRTKEEIEEWRKRDPIELFGKRPAERGHAVAGGHRQDRRRVRSAIIEEAVEFAEASEPPPLDSLLKDVYA